MSKGYRQRVGLAQALLHEPEVLILDEPTSGLDPNQIVEIRNLISSVGKNKTVMLSTHIMQEVEAICDRIIIIHRGKIVANDTTQNIKRQLADDNQKVIVQFDKEVNVDDIKKYLKADSVKITKEKQIEITAKKNIDIQTSIMNFANSNQLTIVQLTQYQRTLEEIFQELTTNN